MNITQKCAQECGQECGIVTYDLNAAKPAMQIQVAESPRFDNIFIMLGPFHIEMAFFKAIGKLIDSSGGPEMLTDTDVLSSGSLNGFLSGKHFNRCKRLHPILALSLEILHFQAFLSYFEGRDELENVLSELQLSQNEETWKQVQSSQVFVNCITMYKEYSDQTISGAHGPTALFWKGYIDFIHAFHILERAIRTNDVDLFTHALTPIIHLFFMMNHMNYARWLTKFQLDLVNMDSTHPGLRPILENGAFTIKRTGKPFSRCPIDLTLEQTINADAASRRTGLSSVTNNYSSRLRWMLTKSARTAIVSKAQEMAGLHQKEDTTAELREALIKRDTSDLQKVIRQIQRSCNPFQMEEAPKKLFNISTGRAAAEPIQTFLLSVQDRGQKKAQGVC